MNTFVKETLANSVTYFNHEEVENEDGTIKLPPCSEINYEGVNFSELCESKDWPVVEEYSEYFVLFDQGEYGYIVNHENGHEVAFYEINSPVEILVSVVFSTYENFTQHLESIECVITAVEDENYYTLYIDESIKSNKLLKYWEAIFVSDVKVHGYLALALIGQYPKLKIRGKKPPYSFKVEGKEFSKFTRKIKGVSDRKLKMYYPIAEIAKSRKNTLAEYIEVAVSQNFYSPDNEMVEDCNK